MGATERHSARPGLATALLRGMRPQQWVKNLLVFAAPIAAGSIFSPDVLIPSTLAFIAFVLASSGTYLLNDVRDVESDRTHPEKRSRPVASGDLPPKVAVVSGGLLIIAGIAVGVLTSWGLGIVVLAYVATTLLYSLGMKHEPVIELGLLATGFLLRAIAGGVAAHLPVSIWFLLVTGFGSLAVAAGKRYSELERDPVNAPDRRRSLEGYTPTYLRFAWSTAAAVTVTTYCLWAVEVGQPDATIPWSLISIIPFVLAVLRYGVDIDAARAQAPEYVIMHDRVLLSLGAAWLLTFGAGALGVS